MIHKTAKCALVFAGCCGGARETRQTLALPPVNAELKPRLGAAPGVCARQGDSCWWQSCGMSRAVGGLVPGAQQGQKCIHVGAMGGGS